MVILSFGIMAAYTWFSQDTNYLLKVNSLSQKELIVEEAIQRLERENFYLSPKGSFIWEDYTVEWTATPIESPKLGLTSVGGASLYESVLYHLHLETFLNGKLLSISELKLSKYQQVREGYSERGID